jgi:hypothetical protein
LGFVDAFLEMQKETLCSVQDPCFVAFDDTPEGRIDLSSNVNLGKITAELRDDRHIRFLLPYSVSDANGTVN